VALEGQEAAGPVSDFPALRHMSLNYNFAAAAMPEKAVPIAVVVGKAEESGTG
jgi:hypothetical protein